MLRSAVASCYVVCLLSFLEFPTLMFISQALSEVAGKIVIQILYFIFGHTFWFMNIWFPDSLYRPGLELIYCLLSDTRDCTQGLVCAREVLYH